MADPDIKMNIKLHGPCPICGDPSIGPIGVEMFVGLLRVVYKVWACSQECAVVWESQKLLESPSHRKRAIG